MERLGYDNVSCVMDRVDMGEGMIGVGKVVTLALALAVTVVVAKRLNGWIYEPNWEAKKAALPPGDLGWPIFGNMIQFLWAFKTGRPQSFIGSFIRRYKRTSLYKAFMFGQPTILAITPEACKMVLMNEDKFVSGWPASTRALMGPNAFNSLGKEEHKRLRKLTAASVNGPHVLQNLMPTLRHYVNDSLRKWASQTAKGKPICLLPELKKLTFQIIADMFMGCKPGSRCDTIENAYKKLNVGVRAMAINFPGTAYHTALKSRAKLVKLLQEVIDERRSLMKTNKSMKHDDILETLMSTHDDNGKALTDPEIIDVLLMYLNAGHESSAHTIMWILIFLHKYPQYLQKVKLEQMEIRKNKQEHEPLTYEDYRKMKYLSQVIDETLRLVNISPMVFRKSLEDVEFSGYTIPKGWHIQTWLRQVHLDEEVYDQPLTFNPERWENLVPKAGTFIPFGAGVHMCPGNDFAKLEMSVFIHYALLDYKFEPVSPNTTIAYLPHPRPKDEYPVRVYKKECHPCDP